MCDHNHYDERDPRYSIPRRHVLKAGGVALGTAVAGCTQGGGGETEAPDPISLAGPKECEVCGMVVEEHPGPNGQIFYRDNSPETHDNPAWFEALKSCFFPYYFEKERFDWKVAAMYITDYSTVDWQLWDESDATYIVKTPDSPSFTDPETFAEASELTFVVGSDVVGSMGPEFIPFSEDGDAESFADEHGGDLYAFDEITVDMLGR